MLRFFHCIHGRRRRRRRQPTTSDVDLVPKLIEGSQRQGRRTATGNNGQFKQTNKLAKVDYIEHLLSTQIDLYKGPTIEFQITPLFP